MSAGAGMTNVESLLRHYAAAGPLMERALGPIPFVWSTLPGGFDGPTIYHGPLSPKTRPKAPVVDVPMASGLHRYPALSADRVEGLVRYGAVEIYSWTPSRDDPTRARFARILLEAPTSDSQHLNDGLDAVEAVLREGKLESLRIYDGGTGAALWIPFTDKPSYEDLRLWLHAECADAVERHPDLLTLAANVKGGAPVHLHVQSNAVGRFSAVPFSVRASPGFPVAIPVDPNALEKEDAPFVNGRVRIENFGEWMKKYEDAFTTRADSFYRQAFGDRAERRKVSVAPAGAERTKMAAQKSHGPIVSAAIAVLQDGQSHDAESILTIAEKRGLFGAPTTQKYVYTSLIEYIARAIGNGRKPAIVQNADRSFRINEPPDLWPALPDEAAHAPSTEIAALIERLDKSADGADTAAFEEAVCDAFEALGFSATHDGGQKAPDGYADAPLGPLSYRTMIECKSGDEGINDPGVFEAAKFKEAFGAQYCALIGRAFSGEIEVVKELRNHGVSAWTVEDLQTVLRVPANPLEIRALLAPGFASEALDDLVWEREHGRAKRVRLIADAIVRTGWTTQAGYRGDANEAPKITEDVAMVLVNADLAAQGSSATCGRDDVRSAIEYLANPLVGLVERDAADGSIVVLSFGGDRAP
ncbi:MAG TPA: hypothetical protein VHT92_08165 [Candidatus Cybelea sp.]|jgi:DNA primase|nr:hypothetical protein [Candidatus Cybelea sp.]